MDFCNPIYHTVQQGDTFYRLAQRYHTTVPDIIARNPGVNPYNLQVGSRLKICNGQDGGGARPEEIDLNKDMRQGWNNHNLWTAMTLTALFNNLGNLDASGKRLEKTPEEISSVFEAFYAQPVVRQLRQLLSRHVELVGEYATALKSDNRERAEQLEMQLNQNAEQIARLLTNMNPEYDYEELSRLLRKHVSMLKDIMMADLNGEYEKSVRLMDENEAHLMELADALTEGLVEQFYRR